jgi:hypothetical protein
MIHVSIIKIVKEKGQAYSRVETKAYQKKDSKLLSGPVCVSADDSWRRENLVYSVYTEVH